MEVTQARAQTDSVRTGGSDADAAALADTGAVPDAVDVAKVGYAVHVAGVDGALHDQLREASRLVTLNQFPPPTVGALRRRARADLDRLMAVLRSEGYYHADIRIAVDAAKKPVDVTFNVTPGPRYKLERFAIAYAGAEDASGLPQTAHDFGISVGGPARAADVVADGDTVLRKLAEQGYPFASIADRKAVVDHDKMLMTVDLTVDPGPLTRFGDIKVSGLKTVEEGYIPVFELWHAGELYDQRKVDQMRTDLVDSGLFSAVTAAPERPPASGDDAPVDFAFSEAEHRTIGGGVNYSTTQGPGVTAFWEHRNFFGRGEDLKVSADAATLKQQLAIGLTKPNFWRRKQSLSLTGALRHENTDAYEELAIQSGAAIDRAIGTKWDVSVGTSLELTKITDDTGKRTFLLLGLPLGLRYDGTDNLLDPTKGSRMRLQVTPYAATINRTGYFFVNELNVSTYRKVFSRLVVAARGRVGSIFGAAREDIPATKRFYAGGGGSIRGVDYQEAGPLDADNDPIGGRSVVETSLELRYRVTSTIGIVPFIDGGTVYSQTMPQFNHLSWGGGLGFRYLTPMGPVRLDLAVPINKKPQYHSFQFYISLGQAF